MPVNMLRKDIPIGEKSREWIAILQKSPGMSLEEKQREEDLAAKEIEALWESEEIGIVKWSGEDGQRYSDAGG